MLCLDLYAYMVHAALVITHCSKEYDTNNILVTADNLVQ